MEFENLTEEQKAKARECKTAEELVKLAAEEDLDLSDEQLEAVAGGRIDWADCDDNDCSSWSCGGHL